MKNTKNDSSKNDKVIIPEDLLREIEQGTFDPKKIVISPFYDYEVRVRAIQKFYEPYQDDLYIMKLNYAELAEIVTAMMNKNNTFDSESISRALIGGLSPEEVEYNKAMSKILATYESRMKHFRKMQSFLENELRSLANKQDIIFTTEMSESEFLTLIEILMQKKIISSASLNYKQIIKRLREIVSYKVDNTELKISYLERILQGESGINKTTIKNMKSHFPSMNEIMQARKNTA